MDAYVRYVVEYLEKMREAVDGRPTSPAFYERYNVARSAFAGIPFTGVRTVGAPYYVTDLGARSFSDPKVFFKAHESISGLDPISEEYLEGALARVGLEELSIFLDACILFFGSYDVAYRAIEGRRGDVVTSNDYDLLIYCGNIYSAKKNDDALKFFEAASGAADGDSSAYAAQHRAAAYEIKRMKEPASGLNRLNRCEKLLIDTSKPRGLLDFALKENLAALALLLLGRGGAEEALLKARESISLLRSPKLTLSAEMMSRAGRYASQVAINEAQLRVSVGDFEGGVDILKRNVETARVEAYDYLPEALSELSYGLFLFDRYEESCRHAIEAFWRLQQIGSLKAVRLVREIIVSNLVRMDNLGKAECVAEQIEDDVLGVSGICV